MLNLGVEEVEDVNATRQECTKLIADDVTAARGAQYPVVAEIVVVSIVVSGHLYFSEALCLGCVCGVRWLGLFGIGVELVIGDVWEPQHASPLWWRATRVPPPKLQIVRSFDRVKRCER